MKDILITLQLRQQLSRSITLPKYVLIARRLQEILHWIILATNYRTTIWLNKVAYFGWHDKLLHLALVNNYIFILMSYVAFRPKYLFLQARHILRYRISSMSLLFLLAIQKFLYSLALAILLTEIPTLLVTFLFLISELN